MKISELIMEFTHGNLTRKINSLNKNFTEINFDLSKIDKINKVLTDGKIRSLDYWIESTYSE